MTSNRKKKRVTVDIGGIEEDIEKYQDTRLWYDLPTTKKLRYLIEEALVNKDKQSSRAYPVERGGDNEDDIATEFLNRLASGNLPDENEIAYTSNMCGINQIALIELVEKIRHHDRHHQEGAR